MIVQHGSGLSQATDMQAPVAVFFFVGQRPNGEARGGEADIKFQDARRTARSYKYGSCRSDWRSIPYVMCRAIGKVSGASRSRNERAVPNARCFLKRAGSFEFRKPIKAITNNKKYMKYTES